jgi:fucokinase
VLSNYVCNHEKSLAALEETQRLAVTMAYELRRGNISAFGQLLSEHMRLLCQLDASSSNLMLDHMMRGLDEWTEGVTLCGAAGGGFMYGVAKEGIPLENIRLWLKQEYEGTTARLYQALIVD